MNTPVLRVDRLRVQVRPGKEAVIDVSFQIQEQEILCLVGESGAGKSVLCRAIAGLLAPPATVTAGEIRVSGQRIDQLSEGEMRLGIWGRQISILLQEPAACLNPVLTIGDQIEETLRIHGASRDRVPLRAIEWLETVGIPTPSTRALAYPHELSGGMKQRVALALALCTSPRLLLADEPTTALDAIWRTRILDLMQSLCHAHGTALLLVTHDISAARMANRVAVMYAGRIVELGPAATILNAPCHPYTQALMQCLPRLDQPRQSRLPTIEGTMPGPGELTEGCAFRPRCPAAIERCAREVPELRPAGPSDAACWLHGERGSDD